MNKQVVFKRYIIGIKNTLKKFLTFSFVSFI